MNKSSNVFFFNNGNFDVEQAMVFGVSAKEKEDAIGHFGTGFKYAVAIILRLGGDIKVETKEGAWEFSSKPTEFRGSTFDEVLMNGKRAGFTTHLGINWESWQAYRELSCNATDENGNVSFEKADAEGYDTVITVDCPEILKAHHERDLHFISGNLIGTYAGVEVYDKKASKIFYQGVEVMKLNKPSRFSYNIKHNVQLTEDRTAKCEYSVRFAIQKCMQLAEDKSYIDAVLEQEDKYYEEQIGFEPEWQVSEAFVEQATLKSNTGKGVSDKVNEILQKHIDKKGGWDEFQLNKIQCMQYDKAVEFLSHLDIDISDYPVSFVKGLGAGVMGRAYKGRIYISEIPFNFGTKQLASTLLEEWVHLHTGAEDFDRIMQSWLFDKILSLAEMFTGEPI